MEEKDFNIEESEKSVELLENTEEESPKKSLKKEIIEYIDLCGLTDDEMKVLYNYVY